MLLAGAACLKRIESATLLYSDDQQRTDAHVFARTSLQS